MVEKTLGVPDVSCGHCKAAVEGELIKLSRVERANADVEKGTVEVSYGEGTVTSEDLKDAIEEAGYTLVGLGGQESTLERVDGHITPAER